jgi:DNA-binding phage protein
MKKNTPQVLINRLLEIEREQGNKISIRSLAIKAGLDYVQFSKSLKKENYNPSFATLERIGDAMGYSITLRAEKKRLPSGLSESCES